MSCIDYIECWIYQMFLEQTQIRVVCPKSQKQKLSSYLSSVFLKHSEQVRNLGIILDNDLSFDNHINKVTLTKNISKVRKFPSQAESEKLVHVFTSGRLDYCNAIFFFFFFTSQVIRFRLFNWIRSKYAEGRSSYCGSILWNKLPADLRPITFVCTFKNTVKTFLFTQSYNL